MTHSQTVSVVDDLDNFEEDQSGILSNVPLLEFIEHFSYDAISSGEEDH